MARQPIVRKSKVASTKTRTGRLLPVIAAKNAVSLAPWIQSGNRPTDTLDRDEHSVDLDATQTGLASHR